jgi:sugar phosphate isomerase/epimerase
MEANEFPKHQICSTHSTAMDLKIYKSLWGMEGPIREQFSRIHAAGYDGIECATQELGTIQPCPPKEFRSLIAEHGFELVSLVYTETADHAEELRRKASDAMTFNPVKIVAHAGRDTMSFGKTIRFFEQALRIEEELGILIAHETHRRRPFYSPMNTLVLLRELPDLHLNADFSHWCVVTESMLEDHTEAIATAARRTMHIHGRVGFENGPQVPDPRIPEWEDRVKKHEAWWDQIIAAHLIRGAKTLTFVPEYGPPTYMPTIPTTGKPTADLWDVCLWSAERFRTQFAHRVGKGH